ncbi:translation elongation factor 4 [Patescibacteria group bacterium]|nr:translation elongation factor 4 [Patescibacteria group bacterium]
MQDIRNFCIIAHVDHGKSTLADRLLEITGTVEKRRMKAQYLDQLELERERGITIKMAPVRMAYTYQGRPFTLNLIDTPGHTDFSYEVSRALAAVDGAILLVDASQGIQAQTLANFNAAKRAGLTIVGAVNKVDLAPLMADEVVKSTAELLGVDPSEIFRVSGKTGLGVEELLRAVIEKVPAPRPRPSPSATPLPFRALIFDSFYHEHKGIVATVRVTNGSIKNGDAVNLIATKTPFKVKELGHFAPEMRTDAEIGEGQIGYVATGLKDPELLKIGDTMLVAPLDAAEQLAHALPGYKDPQPVVFVSFYPEESDNYDDLKSAFGKLRLNDSALRFEPDANEFLGRGFKTGFLGKLHFEITAERLEKEFHIRTVHSFPSVSYKVHLRNGEWLMVTNPKDFPDDHQEVLEPIAKVDILTPPEYVGTVLRLQEVFRLRNITTNTLGGIMLISASLPLSDLIRDFDDQLKSISAGYASLSYEIASFEPANVAKLEVLVATHDVGGLTRIVHADDVERDARKTVERLKDLLPQQQFSQAIQAVVSGKVVARETIPAIKKELGNFGKNGGDITRKMKLWKKQQRGKENLKERSLKSKIDVPASVFKELLKK